MTKLRWLLPALPGALLAFGQEPFAQPLVILPALVALFLLWPLLARSPRQAALVGWISASGYFGALLPWIYHPFLVEADVYGWMAPFAVVLMPAGLALFWAAGGALGHWLRPGPWGVALGVMVGELGRSHLLTGFPWGLMGQGALDTPAAFALPYIGSEGLSLLIVGLAGSVALVVRRRRVLGLLLLLGLSVFALPWHQVATAGDGPLIRLVQPNAAQEDKWDPAKAALFQARLIDATAADPRPALVVWPESALPYLLDYIDPLLPDLAEAADGAPLIFGINRSDDEGLYYNSLVVMDGAGQIAATYDKRHLTPFGEYIPFGEVFARFGIHGLAASEGGGFSAGTRPELLDIPGVGAALPLICYESVFPSLSRSVTRPRFIALITNDAWFGPAGGPRQHLAQARLRALEFGLPVVRVANTGISAMIDARGTIVAQLGLGRTGYLDAPLPPALPETFYVRHGDAPARIVFLLAILATLALRLRSGIDPRRTRG